MSLDPTQPAASPTGRGDWDNLTEVYKNCAAYTCIPALLTPFIQNKELLEKVEDTQQLTEMVTVLARDVEAFANKLKKIYSIHAAKTGGTVDPDDLMRCIGISENYIRWASSYESVILPQIYAILDTFEAAGADTESVRNSVAANNQNQG